MKMTFLALAFILCAHHLQASLGETETELVVHYGKIQGPPVALTKKDVTDQFVYNGYNIKATLLDGLCSREVITRVDKKSFSPDEMQAWLKSNALGSAWQQKDDDENVMVWVLDSKEAFAGYYKKLSMFVVKTVDMLAFEEALLRMQQQQKQAPTPDPTINRNLRP
jgi:hypothetical protein